MQITKKEKLHILISIIFLGFIFGFDDGSQAFNLIFWLKNFIIVTALVALSFLLVDLAKRYIADIHGAFIEYKIWSIKRFGFLKKQTFEKTPIFGLKSFPLGIIISLFIIIGSAGQLTFGGIGHTNIEPSYKKRLGKKFKELTDFETAKIALTGPICFMLLAVIFKALTEFSPIFNKLVLINAALAFSNILPIPDLDGGIAFFTSRYLYFLCLVFILFSILLLNWISAIPVILISLILAVISAALLYYFTHKP